MQNTEAISNITIGGNGLKSSQNDKFLIQIVEDLKIADSIPSTQFSIMKIDKYYHDLEKVGDTAQMNKVIALVSKAEKYILLSGNNERRYILRSWLISHKS